MLQTREIMNFVCGTRFIFLVVVAISYIFYNPTNSGAVQLTSANYDNISAENELMFVNFYADWCRFSQILAPVFDEAADKMAAEVTTPGKVIFAKVDCDQDTALGSKFHISKYPTLKLIRKSQVMKREFRGQRSAESLVEFVKKQIVDVVTDISKLEDLDNVEAKKRIVVAFLDSKTSAVYDVFKSVSSNLRDDCKFFVGVGETFLTQRQQGDTIIFRPPRNKPGSADKVYEGDLLNYDLLNDWASTNCMPTVREITFENAEELTEEGIPFLILFHNPDDTESVEKYTEEVLKQLANDKAVINVLTADGVQFAHPLHHLGKTGKDLPLIAIDSFRHMYLFPNYTEINIPGRLKRFVDELYSGKLHREFHYGPDTKKDDNKVEGGAEDKGDDGAPHPTQQEVKVPTTPPESTFRKLQPSRNRYTLLKDEL